MSDAPTPALELDPGDTALDIQHDTDPADDLGTARRIPHMGHALLFFSMAFTSLNVFVALCFLALHLSLETIASHPGVALLAQSLCYVATLAGAFWLFPKLWHKSFLHGIQWNVLAAHRRWYWIVPSAVALSYAAQFAERFVKMPSDDALSRLMHTAHGAWLITLVGTLIAPLMEEVAFRGFLLPALATAYDWLALERTPAGLRKWETSTLHSTGAVIFGAVFSSIPFALLHAGQLSGAKGAMGILFGVSLMLSFVRIRTYSVACSTLMHMVYNFTIFATLFFSTGGYRHLEKI